MHAAGWLCSTLASTVAGTHAARLLVVYVHVGLHRTRLLLQVFSNLSHVKMNATKSMIGHLTAAAGAVEAVTTILTLRDQIIPPTINLHNPDPQCDLDYVPLVARKAKVNVALSNSFGFGGINAVIALRRWEG